MLWETRLHLVAPPQHPHPAARKSVSWACHHRRTCHKNTHANSIGSTLAGCTGEDNMRIGVSMAW
eukprot:m.242460 g.242460  ORF g.242460 m.242460 type:complete len:65 (+) comp19006_c6_seq24:1579-1773(+)